LPQRPDTDTRPEGGLYFSGAVLGWPTADLRECYTIFSRRDGTGCSIAGRLALTTGVWPGPGCRDGLLLFVRDSGGGPAWRVGAGAGATASLENGFLRLRDSNGDVAATLDVCVVPGRRAELRRLTLSSTAARPRRLEITSLAEVVLNDPDAHAAHPGFSKLFIQTEAVPGRAALLARRRPRSPEETWPLLVHAAGGDGPLQWETDRLRWRGRGRHRDEPCALDPGTTLSGTTGNVLDPVVSLRRTVTLPPGGEVRLTFVLGVADERDAALALADLARDDDTVATAFAAAGDTAAADRATRGWTAGDEAQARELAAALLAADPALRHDRPAAARLAWPAAGKGSDAPGAEAAALVLARLGLRGDHAWVLADSALTGPQAGRELALRAGFWRDLGLPVQLAWLAGPDSPVAVPVGAVRIDPGELDETAFDLLRATARLAVLGPQSPRPAAPAPVPEPAARAAAPAPSPAAGLPATEPLRFFNGHGGFTAAGDEYVVRLEPDAAGRLRLPPLPWTNAIANERFGCLVSETALGSAWCDNSRENRLTPWSNDPVLDPPAEALYLRDDASGARLSCLPGPLPGGGACEARHGFGYTTYRRRAAGLDLETTVFVDRDRPVRLCRVRLSHTDPAPRRLSLYAYSRLVLGGLPERTGHQVVAGRDEVTGALLARNPVAGAFAGHVAFAAAVTTATDTTRHAGCDSAAFLGPDRDPAAPRALDLPALDDGDGTGGDPCFALQVTLAAAPGVATDVWFLLGQERGVEGARALVAALATPAACEEAWRRTRDFWREGLGALRVTTPSPALDLMLNGWLGYQTLSCRVNGRTAFYQSGGAFGFRDQLQDSLALLPYWPELTRRQIVLHAGHQFDEGDVLHWWHPPLDAGIRTHFADDLLWLPYVGCEYAKQTGDWAVFDETASYLTAPALPDGEDEIFVRAADSGARGTVYEHCCRALDRSLGVGAHGLPLFGTGDWNDGMNRVGRLGRGESTWMGFFLVAIIDAFAPLCETRGDGERAARYRAHREALAAALNEGGWDGQWYRRGYYDDGAPLGSRENRECRIDALAQAWSVLSKVAPPARAASALDQVEAQLISDDDRLVRLLTPPFVDTPRDPGYIRGYVAGVRENGGQYTHAATWVVRALAELGRRDRAAAVLDLLNPVLHAATPGQVARYKVEPYVVAADVYGAEPHVGRGGWTWYTGSSGWLQRVALESVLGVRGEGGDTLVVAPCVPDAWPGFSLDWRLPGDGTRYAVSVRNPHGRADTVVAATLDGHPVPVEGGAARVPLRRDGGTHVVEVTLGAEDGTR
jgi:cellobiose phosphorylase